MIDSYFRCVRCGLCCIKREKTEEFREQKSDLDIVDGISIYPEESDVIDMVAELKKIAIQFLEENVLLDVAKKQIIVSKYKICYINEKCPFLKDNMCQIYDNRPLLCRAYPLYLAGVDEGKPEIKIDFSCQGLSDLMKMNPNIDFEDLKKIFPVEYRYIQQIFSHEKNIHKKQFEIISRSDFDKSTRLTKDEFKEANQEWERLIIYTENQ